MTKPLRILLIVTVAILMLGIVISGKLSNKQRDEAAETPIIDSVETLPQGQSAPDDAQNLQSPPPTEKPEYDTVSKMSDKELEPLKKDAIQAMECMYDTYMELDKGSSLNVTLSERDVARLVYTLGENGYSAIDYFGNVDMQNPKNLIDFGQAVNLGQDATACYYTVHTDGRIHANVLDYRFGEGSVVTVSVEWDKDMKPRVYSTGRYSLAEIRYTDKGWLICNRDIRGLDDEKKLGADSYTFVKLLPYDEVKRTYAERYLGSSAYSENNLFTCTWSSEDFGKLDFNCIFPMLYGIYYGTEPLIYNNAKLIAGYESIEGTGLHIVPYDQFQQVIGHFFKIEPETIRAKADSSSRYGGYFMLGAQDGYYSGTLSHMPTPEIVDYWKNKDGSLTMRVDAVYPWYGTDKAFTHELTVLETKEGFKYISNYVYDSAENIFPPIVLKGEREFQIGQLNGRK